MKDGSKKASLAEASALGDDRNLSKNGNNRRYWYGIVDGFNLLVKMRQNAERFDYTKEDGNEFVKKAGEDYSATRENRQRILLTDPYYIDNFAEYLEDDIKTITGQHGVDEHGVDQRAKNNSWTALPTLIIIPLLSGSHWRSIRIQIDYDERAASILYSDPYGGSGFSASLVEKVKSPIMEAVKTLISQHAGVDVNDVNFSEFHKSFDQQGRGRNGWDCGPITFCNIEDYTNIEHTNEELKKSEDIYRLKLASSATCENEIVRKRAEDIESYNAVAGIARSGASDIRIRGMIALIKESAEKCKNRLPIKDAGEISLKISSLSVDLMQMVFDVIASKRVESDEDKDKNSPYTEDELEEAYNLIVGDDSPFESVITVPTEIDSRLKSSDWIADGLKKTFHGNLFQLGLLTLVASRANSKGKPFYLVSEADKFEKFDDLVVDYGERIIFLQAKHSAGEDKYTASDFCAAVDVDNNDASLAKYFDSWQALRNGVYTKKEDGKPKDCQYVFFTNRGIKDEGQFLEEFSLGEEDELLFKGLPTKTVRFKEGDSRTKFVDAIRAYSSNVSKFGIKPEDIDLSKFDQELEDAAKYLDKKLKEFSKTKNPRTELSIDGRSGLSKKTMALITLGCENERFKKALSDKMSLSSKIDEYKAKIKVKIDNPLSILSEVMQTEINKFLDQFVIKIEQPNQKKLIEVVVSELGIRKDVSIGTLELYNALNSYMLQWFAERHNCLLKSTDIGEFIEAEIGDLKRFYLLAGTSMYEEECSDFNINMKGLGVPGLKDFLVDADGQTIALVDSCSGLKYRVYETIKDLKVSASLKDAEWAFIECSKNSISLACEILTGPSTKFLVVDCRLKKLDEGILESLTSVITTANKNNKKLVLLVDSDSKEKVKQLVEKTPKRGSPGDDRTAPAVLKPEEITVNQVKTLCKSHRKKYLTIAGKSWRVSDILNSDNDSSILQIIRDLDYLNEVMRLFSSDKKSIESGLPYDVYVPNALVKGVPKYDLFSILSNSKVKIVIVTGVGRDKVDKELKDVFNKEKKVRYLADESQSSTDMSRYRLLTDINSIPEECQEVLVYVGEIAESAAVGKNCLVCKVIDFDTMNVVVEENLSNAELPIPLGYQFPEKQKEIPSEVIIKREDLFRQKGISIMSANAGFGKSAFCLERRRAWIQSEERSPFWVIRVSLPKVHFSEDPELKELLNERSTDFQWSNWQLASLEEDMKHEGRVALFLDALDEMKDDKDVNKLNKLLCKLPKNVSIVITTRPYAASKVEVPQGKNLGYYLTLSSYDDAQRRKYIGDYVRAIIDSDGANRPRRRTLSEGQLELLCDQIFDKLSSMMTKEVLDLLGVPLESFLLCETLKPNILDSNRKRKKTIDFDSVFGKSERLNASMLYQQYTYTKLRMFLQKHMEMSPETTLRRRHRVYSFTSSYNDLLLVFAYRQAFSLPYEFVTEELKRSYFTRDMIKEELLDTGLVSVEENNEEYFVSFNHESYQEYFAALFLIKTIVATHSQETRSLVMTIRYNPKYRLILTIAAQISLLGDPLIPVLNIEQKEHIRVFWEILCQDGDVLGFASNVLFTRSLRNLSEAKRTNLKEVVEELEWSKDLVACIDSKEGYESDEDLDLSEDFPVLVERESFRPSSPSKLNDDQILAQLYNKDKVVDQTKILLRQGVETSRLASLFDQLTKREGLNRYWWIDGGFRAMSMLGNGFNSKIANRFILAINDDPSWRANPALEAVTKLYHPDLSSEAKKAALKVVFCLLDHRKHTKGEEKKLNRILFTSGDQALEMLIDQLQSHLSPLRFNNPNLLKDEAYAHLFDDAFNDFRDILLIAMLNKRAVILASDYSSVTLVKDGKIKADFGTSKDGLLFRDIVKEVFCYLEGTDVVWEIQDKVNIKILSKDLKKRCEEYCEKRILSTLVDSDDRFKEYFDSIKNNNENLINLYEKLHQYNLLTEYAAKLFIEELKAPRATTKRDYWSINVGIEITGYLGKYFNQDCADYLILRSGFWCDNAKKAKKSLLIIREDLTRDDGIKKNRDAIESYNYCAKKVGADLIELEGQNTSRTHRLDRRKEFTHNHPKTKEKEGDVPMPVVDYSYRYHAGLSGAPERDWKEVMSRRTAVGEGPAPTV